MSTLLSVDLDPVSAHMAVHGLGPADPKTRGVVLERALFRFLEILDKQQSQATFFIVGQELAWCQEHAPKVIEGLLQAQAAGHRVGNHSWSHRYDLAFLPESVQRHEIAQAHRIFEACGLEVEGFRAPGYIHDARLLRQVEAQGYRYDSSRMPSPLYYAAKVFKLATMRLRGRRSVSQYRGFHAFWGDDRPSILPQSSLWEVPISVAPGTMLPMLGGLLLSRRGWAAKAVRGYLESASYVHLHFHGLDLVDVRGDGLAPALIAAQRELGISLKDRSERLAGILKLRAGTQSIEDALRARPKKKRSPDAAPNSTKDESGEAGPPEGDEDPESAAKSKGAETSAEADKSQS